MKKKTIVLTNNNDPGVFEKMGKYHIFDKSIVIAQHINEFVHNTKIENYTKNIIISRELETAIKNKKYTHLVYLLQNSNGDAVKEKIQEIIKKIKNNVQYEIIILPDL